MEKTLNVFWYDLLDEILVFCLDKLFSVYDPEEDTFDAESFKSWLQDVSSESSAFGPALHPIYFELIKTLDEPGYPPYDPKQDSPFESVLMCLNDLDKDRFYDLYRAMNWIFCEDAFEAVTILHKNAFVVILNEFAKEFLRKHEGHTHLYNTNGSVGKKFKLIF